MMPARFSNKGKLAIKWNSLFIQGVDLDRWNRYTEAVAQYERCASVIDNDLLQYQSLFTNEQLSNLKRLCSCVRVRATTLKNKNDGEALTLTEMQHLIPFMKSFTSWKAPFPVVLHPHHYEFSDTRSSASSTRSWADDEEILSTPDVVGQPLLPMLPATPGKHRLTIRVHSIGVNHPEKYIQPFIAVSLKDDIGLSITPDQDVRWPVKIEKPFVVFEKDVEIQRYVENIYKGCAIYFELKYYRKKEKLVTTKCFTFLEVKAIKSGPFTLALFKTPVKYTKRHLAPISKPLYLRVDLSVHD